MIYNSIRDLIGKTPIVKLQNIVPADAADVYVKLEFFNPGGSVKDRIALEMIETAEKEGLLKPGMTIVEPTSGNTGIGLAMVGASKGYPVVIVMPETMSVERQKLMKAYGAKLILTPGAKGTLGAIEKATQLAQADDYFMPMQFENKANPAAHIKTTAPEIIADFGIKQLPDAFVAGVGTGGTLTGVGSALKEVKPETQVYAVEPAGSPVLTTGQGGKHAIQGIGAGFVPEILDTTLYDDVVLVTDEQALTMMAEIGKEEGFLPGISAAANVFAAIEVAKKLGPDHKVLTVAPDGIDRYLTVIN
ncbi:cysteine synthase A [Ligilactobacillus ceti]|uniref:Cysteine synthase n=1 Tax=Ligilactobacillus ceti DSM 22408 TaxID=1122146 RepID=A0A0R2KHB8_9LACO|nr:cysteine synthase A [Ligilactobacillus ceti]KRN88787.1 cysteine synthase [Ligilactobacillus ceti DSM 22408]